MDSREIYRDNHSKETRRKLLAERLSEGLSEVASSRLVSLLGQCIPKESTATEFDIFRGVEKGVQKQVSMVEKIEKTIKYTASTRVECAIYTEEHLITGTVDGLIEVWDPVQMRVRDELGYQKDEEYMFHSDSVILLNHHDDFLVSADKKRCLKVWRITTGKLVKKETHGDQILSVAISKDSVFIGGKENITVLGLKSGARAMNCQRVSALSLRAQRLYVGQLDGAVKILDQATGEQMIKIMASEQTIVDIQKDHEVTNNPSPPLRTT